MATNPNRNLNQILQGKKKKKKKKKEREKNILKAHGGGRVGAIEGGGSEVVRS